MKGWKAFAVACLVLRFSLTVNAVSSSKPSFVGLLAPTRVTKQGLRNKREDPNKKHGTETPLFRQLVALWARGGNFHYYYSKGISIQFMKRPSHGFWWIFPFVVLLTSYSTFPTLGKAFHCLVQWVSNDSWLPEAPEKMSLLSNVVTQVVNGPVVTSISVLFATLISVTISTLHSRQQDVQQSLINEVEALRMLEAAMVSPLYATCTTQVEKLALAESIVSLRTAVTTESANEDARPQRHLNPHEYIALQSDQLLNLCDRIEVDFVSSDKKQRHRPDPRPLLCTIRNLIQTIRSERKNRWIAVTSMHFPMAHYLTLGLLVVSILIAFLVTTDEADYIFLHGLQVRVLWSVLVTCFSSLAVVCVDLSDAFSGAYAVARDFPSSEAASRVAIVE